MALCLRLGKSLGELNAMSAEEFFLWRAFDAESPISDVRGDVLAAITAAAPLQAAGMKISAMDMLPPWSSKVEKPEQEDDAAEDKAETFFAFLRGKAALSAAQAEAAQSAPLPVTP
jgi:hypothetical protein